MPKTKQDLRELVHNYLEQNRDSIYYLTTCQKTTDYESPLSNPLCYIVLLFLSHNSLTLVMPSNYLSAINDCAKLYLVFCRRLLYYIGKVGTSQDFCNAQC